MIYKCIKSFEISWLDENGQSTEWYDTVDSDTLWSIDSEHTISGADIRLRSLDYDNENCEFDCIEISAERLREYFEFESEGE